MEYVVVYLLRGEIAEFHQRKIKELARKFDEYYLMEKKRPSHITLKYNFTTNNITEVEKMLKIFSEIHNSTKIRINGLIEFRKRVIGFKVDFSKEARNVYKDLRNELKKLSLGKWSEFDNIGKKFHFTLVYASSLKKFRVIYEYLNKDKFDCNLKLDNITILRKSKKYWKVHKVYELK